MKLIIELKYFAVLIIFVYTTNIKAQCPQGDVHLSTQAEVIGFQRLYPNCTNINGSLYLGNYNLSDINDLYSLSNIESIDSNLTIRSCFSLRSLSPMHNLRQVRGEVEISGMNNLEDLTLLRNLEILQSLFLSSLSGLKNLDDIANIAIIKEFLFLNNLSVPLPTESSITTAGGVSLTNLSNVTNLDFFSSLDQLDWVAISDCSKLTNIEGLNNVSSSISYLEIRENELLNECAINKVCDFVSLDSIRIKIFKNGPNCSSTNSIIRQCGGIIKICPTEDIQLNGQTEIDNFKLDYPNCKTINGNLILRSQSDDEIVDLSPISAISTILGNFQVTQTKELMDLTGLENLTTVIGDIILTNNKNLVTLDGLQFVDLVTGVNFRSNNLLRDISALNFRNFIAVNITLLENKILADLTPLASLDSIRGSLTIQGMPEFKDFNQLSGVKYIDHLILQSGIGLKSINDLDHLIEINSFSVINTPLETINLGNNIKIKERFRLTINNDLRSINFSSCCLELDYIFIGNSEKIESIDIGTTLQSVSESFIVSNCKTLTNLNIPSNLTEVCKFRITENSKLERIIGGGGLISLNELNIERNDILENIEAFDHSISIDTITIQNNTMLSDCSIVPICQIPELKNLHIINNSESCNNSHSVYLLCPRIIKNPFTDIEISNLEDLNTLRSQYPQADSIHGNLTFKDVEDISVDDLDYFQQIKYIANSLIFINSTFENLDDFEGISFINLSIVNCDNLIGIPMFKKFISAGFINFKKNDNLESISGISQVSSINNLTIWENLKLKNLKGLENLLSIDLLQIYRAGILDVRPLAQIDTIGLLSISYCDSLISLKGMTNISSLHSIRIAHNPSLLELFDSINEVSLEGFKISYNPNLKNLTGFEKVKIVNYMTIESCDSLNTINTLSSLESAGTISISGCKSLKNISLPNINTAIKLKISSNDMLDDVSLISSDLAVEEKMTIKGNPLLDDCSIPFICNHLKRGGLIDIVGNATNCNAEAVVELACGFRPKICPTQGYTVINDQTSQTFNDHYSGCRVLNGDLLTNGQDLTIEPNYYNLKVVLGDVNIQSSGLQSLSFDNLEYIADELIIKNTSELTSINLSLLKHVGKSQYRTAILIEDNDDLRQTPKMKNLHLNFGKISINDNRILKTILGFENIGSPSEINITNNPLLKTIKEMGGISNMGSIVIDNNPVLINLSGFDYDFEADNITVTDNDLLKFCAVTGFCNHIESEREHIIENNASGCNSIEEVNADCIVSVVDNDYSKSDLIVFPNPSNGWVTISTNTKISEIILIGLHGGKQKIELNGNQLNLSNIATGVYVMQVLTSTGFQHKKIVITR